MSLVAPIFRTTHAPGAGRRVLLRAVGGSGAHPYPAAAAPAGVAGRASWQQLPCLTLPLAASSAARRGRGAASPAPSHLRGITCKAATGKLYGGLVAEQQQQVDKYIDILLDYNTVHSRPPCRCSLSASRGLPVYPHPPFTPPPSPLTSNLVTDGQPDRRQGQGRCIRQAC
mmetsp:Transcript_24039/g.75304  ORF Transcript_24039/g.75304 Transcript_24039/m.75304 type:complete len:171 (-) Transcript_24039:753-1265(-)